MIFVTKCFNQESDCRKCENKHIEISKIIKAKYDEFTKNPYKIIIKNERWNTRKIYFRER